ncbi:UvrD-helicase domain-containing protein [Streptomyces rubiginosohelvolus]|uniref:UvrD-helicase domain-containing protein n=1 Tax=Streptomyces TaxID=1883 RepID=UPI000BF1DADC|nr:MULTISPECIES: UvrD-helicase domain-containing protein [unclassified Streptomyces]RDL05148.1 UvrD/REP helicase N-terminal domain-containing protein [Streptomyces sp. HB202]
MLLPFAPDVFAKDKAQALAAQRGLELSHAEQWDFLQSIETLDLQAAPGSGKTSLVGLKLTLLAQGWSSATRGICVLSHTNTAKDEITRRLSDTPAGRRLLTFPHFIGTIQTFTNTFFALPALRSDDVEIQAVDDDAYAEEALWHLDNHPRYRTLRSWTEKGYGRRDLVAGATLVCDAGELAVVGPDGSLPFKRTSPSAQQLAQLKQDLKIRGRFRYSDMFAIAEHHLVHHPEIARATAHRFPFVLLDEMQDTSDLQQHLLDLVFGHGESVVQRVGDLNQGIFVDGTSTPTRPSAFPLPTALQLPLSRRFGTQIAELASQLTLRRRQTIQGAGPEGTIAVLLYDDHSVTRVVPAFERLARQKVPSHILAARPTRVLASRIVPGKAKQFPRAITCYLPHYTTPTGDKNARGLINALRQARVGLQDDRTTATGHAWDAVRRACNRSVGQPLPALSRLERSPATPGGQARLLLHDLLTADIDSAEQWNPLMDRLKGVLPQLTSTPLRATSRLHESLSHVPAPPGLVQPDTDTGDGIVASSIQRAKGETHAATLILECLNSKGLQYDVHETLALLMQDKDPEHASKPVLKAAQLLFVGITRPTHFLAMAMHRTRAQPYLNAFEARGWEIHTVDANI